ncbi:MAG TPA: alpha-L-fucosidase [Candidatus Didemnitutus sp.]|nr:alpha-L-fucosidase [Candidatus Didemnitutus sp.]
MPSFRLLTAILCLVPVGLHAVTPAPPPCGAVPSARQLAWHRLEAYAFVHFTVNTFTDKEWGYGDESPRVFDPTDFDADQIVAAAKSGGLSGVILTCKHHDGFCLWPSAYSDHTIAQSPYRNGHGDIVREISAACARAGLKFGVYLSPWDRNRADYGTPAYIEYYRHQLTELLTRYGPVFEVWFDGANGGDGYYGGARETRHIDNTTYYDWPNTWKIVRTLQPDAVMFSDGGPDVRWVGNERGRAGEPCWATINAEGFFPGHADHLDTGDRGGASWMPAESDVSIRPGWFYHSKEDAAVKSPTALIDIYLNTVGRGTNLIFNLAPDRRGRIPDGDIRALEGFKRLRDETFVHNLAADAKVSASNVRGNDARFAAAHVLDGDRDTYWATDDDVHQAELVVTLPEARTFNLVRLREYLPLGQRIGRVALEAEDPTTGAWREFAGATSIDAQRLISTPAITTRRVRLRVTDAAACPAISEFGLFLRP